MQGFYTYGHNFSHDDNERDASTRYAVDPMNLDFDWGRSILDVRHNFVMNGVWSLPWGFQVSPIVTARSGVPLNVTTDSDSATQTPLNDSRGVLTLFRNLIGQPNAIVFLGGNGDGNSSSDRPWVDGKPFPRNSLSQPWHFNWDLRVSKTVRLTETHQLELLADLLNVTNRANRSITSTVPPNSFVVLSNTNSALVTKGDRNVGDPFSVQLGVKFTF